MRWALLTSSIAHMMLLSCQPPHAASPLPITNDQITWRGDYVGLHPEVPPHLMQTVVESDAPGMDASLLNMLEAEEGWIAAHVLLSLRSLRDGGTLPLSGASWNGLRVQLHQTGKTSIDPAQRPAIRTQWSARHGTPPPPHTKDTSP